MEAASGNPHTEKRITVKARYNGSKGNGNPPIMYLKFQFLHVIFF